MPTWTQMFPGQGDPISGQSEDYRQAATIASSLERTTTVVSEEFARVRRSNELGELSGMAADQLTTLIKEVSDKLDHVPPFFRQLDWIFDHHATRLKELERKAADALARANARWSEIESAEQDEQAARSALSSIEYQIRQLDWSTDEPEIVEARRNDLEGLRTTRLSTLEYRISATGAARQRLADIGEERRQLELTERALVQRTAERLQHLDVGELADPNAVAEWIRNRIEDVGGFVSGIVDNIVDLVKAVADGRWMDALWHLSDLLEDIMTIVGAIAMAIAFVALVVGTGGGALALLGTIGLVLGVMKLASDTALLATQHPHPESGRTMTLKEVLVTAAFVAVDLALMGASKYLNVKNLAGPHKRTLTQNVKQTLHPVSKHGDELYGAARSASRLRSVREVVDTAENFSDSFVGEVAEHVVDEHARQFVSSETDPLPTDVNSWTEPSFVDFVEGSPSVGLSVRTLEVQTASISDLELKGPSLEAGSAQYQLVAA